MISIVIPLYNKAAVIKRTLCSVFCQTYSDFEIIIVNDGSKDNFQSELNSLNDERLRLVNQENQGVSAARNRGCKECRGEYVLFLDADDFLLPNCLATLIRVAKNFNTDVVASNYLSLDENGRYWGWHNRTGRGRVVKQPFRLWAMTFPYLRMGNFMVRRSVLENNQFNTEHSRYEDYEFLFSLFRKSSFAMCDIPVMVYTFEYAQARYAPAYQKDYISTLNFNKAGFFEKLCLASLLKEGLENYPSLKDSISQQYSQYLIYIRFLKVWHLLEKAVRKCIFFEF